LVELLQRMFIALRFFPIVYGMELGFPLGAVLVIYLDPARKIQVYSLAHAEPSHRPRSDRGHPVLRKAIRLDPRERRAFGSRGGSLTLLRTGITEASDSV
jgi:hypothetical protein